MSLVEAATSIDPALKPDIFRKRTAFRPFQYDVLPFVKAIQNSFWVVEEFSFEKDIQNFHVDLTPVEKSVAKNAILAISQIEVAVKRFWGSTFTSKIQIPEFELVGATFSESEVRHALAYSHLLDILGLNDEFAMLLQNPQISGRVDYLSKYLRNAAHDSEERFALTLALFSLFVENVSLFSQFLIMKSFNRHKNYLATLDNVIMATQKEECHSEDTEILTDEGWKSILSINTGDTVVAYNNGSLTLEQVTHTTQRHHTGTMYHYHNNNSDCLVTPNHDMVYIDQQGKQHKQHAEDFVPSSTKIIPRSGKAISASGWFHDLLSTIRVTSNKEKTVFTFTEDDNDLLGEVQAAAIMAGYKTNIVDDVLTYGDINSDEIIREKIEDYDGMVGCVTVPSGVIVTRRNNKTFIAGNCIHAMFGAKVINIIREEHPEWFNEEFEATVKRACLKAYKAESEIIDWIFEEGTLEFLSVDTVKEFIKHRFNESVAMIGCANIFEIDEEKLKDAYWFIEEEKTVVNSDFFYKRPVTYSKKMQSFTEDDLF